MSTYKQKAKYIIINTVTTYITGERDFSAAMIFAQRNLHSSDFALLVKIIGLLSVHVPIEDQFISFVASQQQRPVHFEQLLQEEIDD